MTSLVLGLEIYRCNLFGESTMVNGGIESDNLTHSS